MNKNVGIKMSGTKPDNSIIVDTPSNGKENPNSKTSLKSAGREIQFDNKNVFSSFDNINEQSKYSFNNFIKEFQDSNLNRKAPWNKERERYLRESDTKKRILLKEINQFEYNDPLKILDESYTKDNYNTILFANQIKHIQNIFSEVEYMSLIDTKERLDMIKKIIEYYLNYVVEVNFDSIMKALKKINSIEINLEMSLIKVKESKHKMNEIKDKILLSSAKFLLLKQKLKNLLIIHKILKEKLLSWKILFTNSKGLKSKNNFCLLWKNITQICDDIQSWSKQGTNSVLKRRPLIINEILLRKCKSKLTKLQDYVEKQLNNTFLESRDNFLECYKYFMINSEMTNENFIDLLFTIYRKTIFQVIKGTLISFSEDQRSSLLPEIKNTRDLARLRFEENKFVSGFNQLMKNMSKVGQCFESLILTFKKFKNDDEKQIYDLLETKRSLFFERVDKKFSKLIQHFRNNLKEMNKKNMINILIYNSLFVEVMKSYFNVEMTSYLEVESKSLFLEYINYQNMQNIKKVGILLGGDNWKRVALNDDHDFFSEYKLQEKVSFSIKTFLIIFNKDSSITKSNIKENFLKYMNALNSMNQDVIVSNYSQRNSINGTLPYNRSNSIKTNSIQINKITTLNESSENDLIPISDPIQVKFPILSKQIDNKKFILSSSTINLVKSLQDLVSNFVLFESLSFDIFSHIFYLVDYYIFASLKMFIDKKYFVMLFEEFNAEDVRKKGKIEQAVETVLFQKRFSKLRKYLIKVKKNFEMLFEMEIDIIKSSYEYNNDNYEINDFYMPKFNSNIIINDSNVYSCMVESIILYESIISMKKIFKRLSHFTDKIELEFRSKYVIDTINEYKDVLEEMKAFIYRPICANIFKMDPILNRILNYRWDPKESESISPFSEPNQFVDYVFQEICEKYDKLYLLSGGSLTEKSQKRFLDVMLIHMIEKLMDTFSKIKKCNSYGRSIMLKDIKFLKSKIESKFSKEVNHIFGELELFINSWYCTDEEFLKYVEDNHLNYKFVNGILNTGINFVKHSRQQRKDYCIKLDETYLMMLENIRISLINP